MKIFKKKPIIITTVLLTVFLIIGIGAIVINSNKETKSNSKNTSVSEKKEKVKENKSKIQNNKSSEDIKAETNEVIKKESKETNESDELKDNDVVSGTNNNSSNTSSSNNSNNSATNNSSNTKSSNNTVNNNQAVNVNTDEQDWNNFINDYSTLLILGGTIDFYSQSEQVAESNKWVNLGYRTELPTVCTYLSTGQICVYSLFVFAGEGTCGTSNSISVNWRSRNYISDIDYLKSLGYNCP